MINRGTKPRWAVIAVSVCLLGGIFFGVFFDFWSGDLDKENPICIGGEFTLMSDTGPVSLSSYAGQVVLIFFGYTYCPDVCPIELARMSSAFRELSLEEASQTRGLFITIDPERDTIKRVSDYAGFFHDNIVGLTGKPEEISEVAKKFSVVYQKSNDDDVSHYVVDHSTTTYLIGRDGLVSNLLRPSLTSIEVAEAIQVALKN